MEAKINGKLIFFKRAWGNGSLNGDFTLGSIHRINGDMGYRYTVPNGKKIFFDFSDDEINETYSPHFTYVTWEGDYVPDADNVKVYNTYREAMESFLTITYTENNTYKGTFFFTAISTVNSDDKLIVTDGKFEIS